MYKDFLRIYFSACVYQKTLAESRLQRVETMNYSNGVGGEHDIPDNAVPRTQTIEFAPTTVSRPHRLSTLEHGPDAIAEESFPRRQTVDTVNEDRSRCEFCL